jgi:hypothetical protein
MNIDVLAWLQDGFALFDAFDAVMAMGFMSWSWIKVDTVGGTSDALVSS